MVPQLDRFGYPLNAAFFNRTTTGTLTYASTISILADFTLCFHVKQQVAEGLLFKMTGSKVYLKASFDGSGRLEVKLVIQIS